jgi:hypothetical protein
VVLRLLGPLGFVLVLATFALPFLLGGVPTTNPFRTTSQSVTFTGFDLVVGGAGDVRVVPYNVQGIPAPPATLNNPPRPGSLSVRVLGVLTIVLIGAGLLATLIPSPPIRATVAAFAALTGALSLIGLELDQRQQVAQNMYALFGIFRSGPPVPLRATSLMWGYWAALALLIALGLAYLVQAVRTRPAPDHD